MREFGRGRERAAWSVRGTAAGAVTTADMDPEGGDKGTYGAVESSPAKDVATGGGSGDSGEQRLTPGEVADLVGFGLYHQVLFFVGAFCIACEMLEVAFLGFLLTELTTTWNLTRLEISLLGTATFVGQLVGYSTAVRRCMFLTTA